MKNDIPSLYPFSKRNPEVIFRSVLIPRPLSLVPRHLVGLAAFDPPYMLCMIGKSGVFHPPPRRFPLSTPWRARAGLPRRAKAHPTRDYGRGQEILAFFVTRPARPETEVTEAGH
jgi:hypothetical protein